MSPEICTVALLVLLLPLLLLLLLIHRNPIPNKGQHQQLPSPPKLPFIGNAHQLGSLPHRSLHLLSQRYGPIMLLKLGRVQTVVISSADFAKEIMKTYDHIFSSRPPIKAAKILFNGGMDVAFANGEHWRQGRKLCVNHLLSSKMVQSLRGIQEEEVASLVARISASSSLGALDMSELLSYFLNNIMCRAVLGNFSRKGINKVLSKLISEDVYLLQKFYVGDYFPFLGWLDEVSGLGAQTRRLAKRWNDFLKEIIEDRANMIKDENDVNGNSSFVDVLLSLEKDQKAEMNLTREVIMILVHEMILAGTDTSFVVLEWGMTELIRNSEAMQKLKYELREIARGEPNIREEDLCKTRYLKAVIKEIMRLHPPGPLLVPREATQDCLVQGYIVPARARVLINTWSIGRDPKIWDAPDEFRPERFMDSNVDFRGHDFELIPFGAGRRICPGFQFAVYSLELALANLVHQFDWQLPDGTKAEDLNMEEAPGIAICRKERLCLVAKKMAAR